MRLRFGPLASAAAVDVMRVKRLASIGLSVLMVSLTPVASQAVPITNISVTPEGFDFRLQDVSVFDPDYQLFFFFSEPFDALTWAWRLEVGHVVSHRSPGDPRFLNFYWEAHHLPNAFSMEVGRTLTMSATDAGVHHTEAALSLLHAVNVFAPTLDIDDFVSTLDYVVGPSSEILAYDFRLTGRSRSVPEPSTLLLVGFAAVVCRGITTRQKRTFVRFRWTPLAETNREPKVAHHIRSA